MSYEEIDRDGVGADVFTNGAEGRYSKAKLALSTNGTSEKKRAPKAPTAIIDDIAYENGHSDEVVKIKKKIRKVEETGETQNEYESAHVDSMIDEETVAKPKKKRAPKAEANNENAEPVIPTNEEEPVKKKKNKAPKLPTAGEDLQLIDGENVDATSTEKIAKIKKTKKQKAPKATTEQTDDMLMNNTNEYTANAEFNDIYTTNDNYASNIIDAPYDAPLLQYSTEAEQIPSEPIFSEYETSIRDAYSNLASNVDFSQYLTSDQWCIVHLPKSARNESKSRIRKIMPGMKDEKNDGKASTSKIANQKGGFLNRLRSGVNSLVRDETNLIFGERSHYDVMYYEEEEEDGVDTDDLHRYAQKLRELEDNDKEVNPEYLVLRDGKTVYAVRETDAEGKMTLATRKPIYDRLGDQAPDSEPTEKKNILSRLRNPFSRNKDKDNKGVNSPKTGNDTLDSSGKRSAKKSSNKNADDGMTTTATSEPFMD